MHIIFLCEKYSCNALLPGNNFAVVHCTGYIKNWPPQGISMDRNPEEEMHASSSCCLVAIGRLQVNNIQKSFIWSILGLGHSLEQSKIIRCSFLVGILSKARQEEPENLHLVVILFSTFR